MATGHLVINLSKKDKAVVSDEKYSGDSYKENFASSKPVLERMTAKLKHTQTPVSIFLSLKIFIRKKLKEPGVGGKEIRKNKVIWRLYWQAFCASTSRESSKGEKKASIFPEDRLFCWHSSTLDMLLMNRRLERERGQACKLVTTTTKARFLCQRQHGVSPQRLICSTESVRVQDKKLCCQMNESQKPKYRIISCAN